MPNKKPHNSVVQPEESESKKVPLDPEGDSSKFALIGAQLDPK